MYCMMLDELKFKAPEITADDPSSYKRSEEENIIQNRMTPGKLYHCTGWGS